MKIKPRGIRIILVLLLSVLLFWGFIKFVRLMDTFAGSNTLAEYYECTTSPDYLIKSIEEFKKHYPSYKLNAISDRTDDRNIFHYVYFTLPNEKAKIVCVIIKGGHPTLFGLSAISYEENVSGWKQLNTKDLSKNENERIKKIFENEILDRLNISWKKQKKWYNAFDFLP